MAAWNFWLVTALAVAKVGSIILEEAFIVTQRPSKPAAAAKKAFKGTNDPATGEPDGKAQSPLPKTLVSHHSRELSSRLRATSGIMAAITFVFGALIYARLSYTSRDKAVDCGNADADIVGDGVRIATWIQEMILLLIVLCGTFHFSPTAVKEVGGGLLITHLSLVIALLVPLGRHELSLIDAVLGAMVLDAQNVALSIQLSTKEALAARWQVWVVLLGQMSGLITIAVLISMFQQDRLRSKDCACFSVFWWGWFTNCPATSPTDMTIWAYYSLRTIYFAQCAYRSLTSMALFDMGKKQSDQNPCAPCKYCQEGPEGSCSRDGNDPPCSLSYLCVGEEGLGCRACLKCGSTQHCAIGKHCTELCKECGRCRICRQIQLREGNGLVGGLKFGQQPATISLLYVEHCIFAVWSMIAVESTISSASIQPSSTIYAVGQITPMVVAVATTARAFWVATFMFFQATTLDRGKDKAKES